MRDDSIITGIDSNPMSRVVILYGTETFNSYEYAVLLANRLQAEHYDARVYSMDDFELKRLLEIRVLILISSTFGNGDNPRNTKKFWRFMLQRKLPVKQFLDHIYFTTFGLGDSSYPRYNYFIRKLHARMLQLGARELSVRGEGDEQSPEGVEAFYKEWEITVVEGIKAKYPPDLESQIVQTSPRYKLDIQTKRPKRKTTGNPQEVSNSRYSASVETGNAQYKDEELRLGEITTNQRLTSTTHFQDVRHITIQDIHTDIQYRPGDIISLYPLNQDDDVEALIQDQGWLEVADCKIEIVQGTKEYSLNIEGGLVKPLTLRSLLTHHLDIMAIPRRSFFMNIYRFTLEEREQEKLKEFSELEFTEDLYNYADRPRRSILETVMEFGSLKIPVEYVLDVFPILRPRLFSIASGPHPRLFDLCVAIVKYRTIIKRIRRGVCTNWLKDLLPGTKVIYSIKRNDVYSKFSKNLSDPLVLIGPGTGIAPIRSIIQDRLLYVSNDDPGKLSIYLFSGNRSKSSDFLYGEYFEELEKTKRLTLFPAFSRDDTPVDGKRLKYVQDQLYHNKELVYDAIINKNGTVYLCGASGKMPIQTRITIQQIIEEVGGVSTNQAALMLLKIENEFRYLQETW